MKMIPNSSIPGIGWPAIVEPLAAQAMALQYQLEQSQWWSAEELLAMQLQQLSPLIRHAHASCPFYAERYNRAGYQPPESIDYQSWQQLPIISREEVHAAGSALNSKQMLPQHGKVVTLSTSGSTGRQVNVQSSEVGQFIWHGMALRDELWHQRDVRGKLAVIRSMGKGVAAPPDGTRLEAWGGAISAVYQSGESVLLDSSATVEQQLNWLCKHQPDYLLTYPSNLRALAHAVQAQNIELTSLKCLRTLGEVVDEQLRDECQNVFGVPLTDIYSCQEIGYLAIQCPQHGHYHVQCENVLLEVLNEDDQPCRPGEVGRVVISSLHNFATPLIRYDIGDYAEVGEPCACGRGLPVLKRIVGRVRNMVSYPDGSKRWPFVGSGQYHTVADIQQFQLVQSALDVIEVHLVVVESLSAEQEKALGAIITDALQYPFTLSFHYHREIPRSAGGKFEDFISRI